MAGVRNSTQRREVNIGAGMDTSAIATAVQQITGSLKGLTAEIQNISRSTANSIEPMQRSFKKVSDTSGLAGASIMGMTGIIQDSNYGIRGMANNIQFVVPLLGQLVKETGSVTGAMKSLWKQMWGPLGVMMLFSVGITLLEKFAMRKKEVAKESEKAGDKFIAEGVEVRAMFGYLENLIRNHGDLNEIKRTAKGINEKYNTTLNTEKVTLQDISKEYLKVAEAIKIKSKLAIASKEAELGQEKQFAAEKALIELNQKLTKQEELRAKVSIKYRKGIDRSIKATNDEIAVQEKAKQDAINQQNIGIAAQIALTGKLKATGIPTDEELKELEELKKAREEAAKKAKQALIDKIEGRQAYVQNQEALNELVVKVKDLQEEELRKLSDAPLMLPITFDPQFTTPIGKMKQEFIKFTDDLSELQQQVSNNIDAFIKDSVVGLFDALGQELGGNAKAIDDWGKQMIAGFGGFLQKMGAMIITYGFAMDAFKKAWKNPYVAIAAGAALIAIGGAIKAAHNKKMGAANPSGGSNGDTSFSNGYNNNEMYMYSRLDGRDLVLSNQRAVYQQRR